MPGRRRTPRDGSAPRLPRDVVVLGAVAFFVMLGFGVVVPVLPVYVRSFDVGFTAVGVVVAAFAVMRLVANPFVGRLIDRFGERGVLATGIGIVAASSALTGLADSYAMVLVLRGLGGIGSAMFSVAAMTRLLGSTDPGMRGRAAGFYQGGFLVGGMAGPAVGGLLGTISLHAPFFFYAGTLTVAGTVGLVLLSPSSVSPSSVEPAPARPLSEVARDVRFRVACIAGLAQGWAAMGVRSALVPVLVVEGLRGPTAWTGIAFAVAAVAQTLALVPAGRFVDTVGRRSALVGALALEGVVLALMPAAPDIVWLGLLIVLTSVAAAFLGTAPAALVGDAAGGRSGRAVGVFQAFGDLGSIIGPIVAGALLDVFSFGAAFASAAVLALLAAGYALRLPRERARDSATRRG